MAPNKGIEVELLHKRLGHIGTKKLKLMHDKSLVNGFNIQTNPLEMNLCNDFLHEGQQVRNKILTKKGSRATQLLELVHSDLCGPNANKLYGRIMIFWDIYRS
jgi:hypothetical protein